MYLACAVQLCKIWHKIHHIILSQEILPYTRNQKQQGADKGISNIHEKLRFGQRRNIWII